MVLSILSSLLLPLFVFSFLQTPTSAIKQSYIVYMGAQTHGLNPTSADLDSITNSHYELLGSFVGSSEIAREKIFYSYTRNINGFAAVLDEKEAADIAKHPKVVSVFLNKGKKLHTTRSWDFIRLERDGIIPNDSLWKKSNFGADVVIGNLDTGVWPESKSFSDEGMGQIPLKWRGMCHRDTRDGVVCNRKLIGARYFNKGYMAFLGGKLNDTYKTARDSVGHGTHTLSTAGGNFVPGANIFRHGNGTAKGGSPGARVAAYKVCWPPVDGHQCFDADIMAGFEAAISDGVDVLSVSLGGDPSEFFEDGLAIGAFHAVANGISVVLSAGNSGPSPGTVSNIAPWMFTVGASTLDREFVSYVELGNKKKFKGASLSPGALKPRTSYPLITGEKAKAAGALAEDATLCQPGSIDPKKAKGKILVCLRGITARTDKGKQALKAGAVGMILANDEASGNELIADPHFLPATQINFTDGRTVFAYINSSKKPMGYITPVVTKLGLKPAPSMAAFSSRGPNIIEPSILKPDITAPGVNILAAVSELTGPTEDESDKRRIPFGLESGTSMSCPHVSGIVGLLKSLHPHWSAAAIKSAIMTTARIRDNTGMPMVDADNKKATPFAYGSGHVRPNRAMDPGLVYDLAIEDYLNFLCARGYNQTSLRLFSDKPFVCPKSFNLMDFNYPSIAVPELNGTVTVSRTVKNVGPPRSTYKARVRSPAGVTITVIPSKLRFKKCGEEKRFKVTIKSNSDVKSQEYVFGELLWSDGKHNVRSPIAVWH
ncbi:hypothetical protein like AT5G59810 [Hibiscus trionum]|uniref:Subtilisin-like protease SBT5.4 n=1 Tax=Hibiscus trionum TaxID=183268 RepID=A0A9W7HBY3_HIBTR|nr:hypothetical protein like AT5G59810 [Hibiscus trionum]